MVYVTAALILVFKIHGAVISDRCIVTFRSIHEERDAVYEY